MIYKLNNKYIDTKKDLIKYFGTDNIDKIIEMYLQGKEFSRKF